MQPPSKPILVFAGTVRQARDWAVAKGISPAWIAPVTPHNMDSTRGMHGNPHVIVCGQLTAGELLDIRDLLEVIGSDPWEEPDELCVANLDRPAHVG